MKRRLKDVRYSDLKVMGVSPAHFEYRLAFEQDQKRNTTVGTTAHAMVLGGEEPVIYDGVRNKKAAAWIECQAKNAGKLILIQSEYDAAAGCAASIRRHKRAMELLEGEHEQELKPWVWAGRRCGGRPDVKHPKRIVELKTSVTAEPFRFTRLGIRMGYHGQLAWYLDGNAETGGTATEAFIVVVETTPPYVVTTMPVSARALEAGRKLYSIWFEHLRACEESDQWPAYAQDDVDFDVPEDEIDLDFSGSGDDEAENESGSESEGAAA